jgi:hypothetical protein
LPHNPTIGLKMTVRQGLRHRLQSHESDELGTFVMDEALLHKVREKGHANDTCYINKR